MQSLEKASHCGRIARIFSVVFAEFACAAIKRPRLRNLHCQQFYHYIHRSYAEKIVGEMCAYAKRRDALVGRVTLQLYSRIHIKCVAEHHLLGARVDTERAIFIHYHVEFAAVVATVHPQPLEHVGVILRKIQTEYAPAVSVVKKCPQRAPVGMRPRLHGYVIGHLRAIHPRDAAYQLMSHGADRRQVILHGEIHVARAYETSGTSETLLTLLHGSYQRVLCLKRCPAPCAEIAISASGFYETLTLVARTLVKVAIVETGALACHHIIKFGDYGEHLHLKQYGVAPAPLKLYAQMSLFVLTHSDPAAVVTESFEKTVKPHRYVATLALHELYLLVGHRHRLEHLYLSSQLVGKARRIHSVVTVAELVFHPRARIILYHGTTHRELIQVVIGEMSYYLSHDYYILMYRHGLPL